MQVMSNGAPTTLLVLIAIGLTIYFVPFFIAKARHHHNSDAILVLNLLLGWTLLGWIGALVWAFTATRPVKHNDLGDDLEACPFCAEQIKATATVCRYCQREIPEAIMKIRADAARVR
jgi:RsiW-degrading membrane proteinase PrsW (M82 family)